MILYKCDGELYHGDRKCTNEAKNDPPTYWLTIQGSIKNGLHDSHIIEANGIMHFCSKNCLLAYLFKNPVEEKINSTPAEGTQPEQSFTREEVIELLAKYGDHYSTGMAQDKWTDPDFKGNIIIATEFLDKLAPPTFKEKTSYTAFHKPTGEEWLLLGIDVAGDRVCAAGYPPTMGKLSDCENIKEGDLLTEEELIYRASKFGMRWN